MSLTMICALRDGETFKLPHTSVEGKLISKSVGCCTVQILSEPNKPRVQWSLGTLVEPNKPEG